MGTIGPLLRPTIDLIQKNSYVIVLGIILIAVFIAAFYLTMYTLKSLKMEIFSYYPFDRFFPASGSWSVFYFLVVIILLGALIFLLSRGGFYLAPA